MATTSIWDKLKNIIMPSTTGPVQVADPNIAMWQGMQQMEQAKQQGQANNLAAVLKFQADQQAQKDLGNQALQNQLASRPGAAWGPNGILRKEQLANPALEAIPNWARAEFVNTPAGMRQALGVSQVQNPYVNPNSVPSAAPAGVFSAPIMEQQRQDAGGLNNVQVGKGAWTNSGQLVGFSDVGDGMASRNMASAMRIAQSPWANWSNMIGKSNEAVQDPAILAAMRLQNPAWTPTR